MRIKIHIHFMCESIAHYTPNRLLVTQPPRIKTRKGNYQETHFQHYKSYGQGGQNC